MKNIDGRCSLLSSIISSERGTYYVKNSRIFDVGNLEVVSEMTNKRKTGKNKLRYLYNKAGYIIVEPNTK